MKMMNIKLKCERADVKGLNKAQLHCPVMGATTTETCRQATANATGRAGNYSCRCCCCCYCSYIHRMDFRKNTKPHTRPQTKRIIGKATYDLRRT